MSSGALKWTLSDAEPGPIMAPAVQVWLATYCALLTRPGMRIEDAWVEADRAAAEFNKRFPCTPPFAGAPK